jgi:tryptophanase
MHEVVRLAIQERIARQDHTDRVRQAARRVATQHRETLDRLKDA